MKRDDVVLPLERNPLPVNRLDPVREGMNHYYNRDPLALQALLEKLVRELKDNKST